MPKNDNPERGPTQAERRRHAANRPLGGSNIPKQKIEPESPRKTRIERASTIVSVIMLIALLLSILSSCVASTLSAKANQEIPPSQISYASSRFLQRQAAELAPTASLSHPPSDVNKNRLYVGETGHYVGGSFLEYYNHNGGGAVFGDPLSEEYSYNGRLVQLYEKAILELHFEQPDPKDQVQLGFLGRELANARHLTFTPTTNLTSTTTRNFYKETSQAIAGDFKVYWEKNNGLALLGFPISPETKQDDKVIQYFERGLLQTTADKKSVELANAGNDLIAAYNWPPPNRLKVNFELDGNEIYQGRTLAIQLNKDGIDDLTGRIGEQALKWSQIGTSLRTFTTFAAWAEPKPYDVKLFYTDAGGRDREWIKTIKVIDYPFPKQNLYLPDDKVALTNGANDADDEKNLATSFATYTPKMLWSGFWSWPAWGEITTEFGQRRAYGDSTEYNIYHGGIDIAQPQGAAVAAPADGKVIYTGTLLVRGNIIGLDHGLGITSYYAHLSNILVKPGDIIKKGQTIGQVGTTGRSDGPHLHWEVRVNGIATYPVFYINHDVSK